MATSKIIRRNKEFLKSEESPNIEEIIVRGQLAPLQTRIREFVFKNPNCIISDLYKAMPEIDTGIMRGAIRVMVESHRIIQRFTID